MKIKSIFFVIGILLFTSCYNPERKCADFTNGTFSFTSEINGEKVTTIFERQGALEVDQFNGKIDSSSIRWINDCEYITKKINPKNKAEEKSVHIKILSTTTNSYVFEYSIVGENKKIKGTAIKTN